MSKSGLRILTGESKAAPNCIGDDDAKNNLRDLEKMEENVDVEQVQGGWGGELIGTIT